MALEHEEGDLRLARGQGDAQVRGDVGAQAVGDTGDDIGRGAAAVLRSQPGPVTADQRQADRRQRLGLGDVPRAEPAPGGGIAAQADRHRHLRRGARHEGQFVRQGRALVIGQEILAPAEMVRRHVAQPIQTVRRAVDMQLVERIQQVGPLQVGRAQAGMHPRISSIEVQHLGPVTARVGQHGDVVEGHGSAQPGGQRGFEFGRAQPVDGRREAVLGAVVGHGSLLGGIYPRKDKRRSRN